MLYCRATQLILMEFQLDKFRISRGPVKFLTTMTKMTLSVSVNTEKYFEFFLVYTVNTNH